MRAGVRNRVEVRAERFEWFVVAMVFEQEVGLDAMVLEVVHLAVLQTVFDDRLVRRNGGMTASGVTHPEEGQVGGELADPATRGRRRYLDPELFAHAVEHLGQGLEAIVSREHVRDDPHWVRAVLGGRRREAAVTEGTVVALHRTVLGRAHAVFRDARALAVGAGDSRLRGMAWSVVRATSC